MVDNIAFNFNMTSNQIEILMSTGVFDGVINLGKSDDDELNIKTLNIKLSLTDADKLKFIRSFPEVTEEERTIAKKFLEDYIHSDIIRTDKIVKEQCSMLSKIPYAAFVGLTGIDYFDSEITYSRDHGYYGKLNEYLFTGKLPNCSKGKDDEFFGEMKTMNSNNSGVLTDMEVCSYSTLDLSSFEKSDIHKKIESGITIFAMESYKSCRRLIRLYYLDTKPNSFLHQEFVSDFEIGKLNSYNTYLKKGTKNSGKTSTVKIPKEIINEYAQLIHSF